jgi:phage tail-like protein
MGAATPDVLEPVIEPPSDPPVLGEFALPTATLAPSLAQPSALAVDANDRLFVAETGARRILVYDLWSRRLLRRLGMGIFGSPAPRPIDLAAQGSLVWALLDGPPRLISFEARRDPAEVASPIDLTGAVRLAVAPGSDAGDLNALYALVRGADGISATVVPFDTRLPSVQVPRATDLEFDGSGALVVARSPGEDFVRFRLRLSPSGGTGTVESLTPLKARGYDGAGIVRQPDGNIGYWSPWGFRTAVAARVRYVQSGRVTTYRLDSGAYQTTWGRLFIDACIPEGTSIRVRSVTVDEMPEGATIPQDAPANIPVPNPPHPEQTPPMLPAEFKDDPVTGLLHRRETGRELPWVQIAPDDRFETYEAPIIAPPGRYLWVTLELRGDTARTPRVRSLRAEHPSHDWVQRIPKTFSTDADVGDFLRRYLAMFDGTLSELEARSTFRLALIDPKAAPPELLPWLASFFGLVIDERFPEAARRTLIAEIVDLFRYRGTIHGLRRFLEIYLGVPIQIIERFRLRGVGARLSASPQPDAPARSVIGGGFRVGGPVGTGEPTTPEPHIGDAFRASAHRFTVLIAGSLTTDQRSVVESILQMHRPAHTLYDYCTVDAGMRVGLGLLVEISSMIGRTGGFSTAQIGNATIGRDSIIGRPSLGTMLDGKPLGEGTRVG